MRNNSSFIGFYSGSTHHLLSRFKHLSSADCGVHEKICQDTEKYDFAFLFHQDGSDEANPPKLHLVQTEY